MKQLVLDTLSDAKAKDIVICDVREASDVADYFVICTATSQRHSSTLAEKLVIAVKAAGITPLGIEGKQAGLWVLVDLNQIIVHIMQKSTREFYQLEKLWASAADSKMVSDNS